MCRSGFIDEIGVVCGRRKEGRKDRRKEGEVVVVVVVEVLFRLISSFQLLLHSN